jgi:hypothetical protein
LHRDIFPRKKLTDFSDQCAGCEHFVYFIRVVASGKESRIIISRKYGEQATFRIEDGKALESYGECARKYMDPEWFIEE